MTPFTYPSKPHLRRHGPQGYAEAASYRPWLRDEFTVRCVYCVFREQWEMLRGTIDVEHFRPITSNPGDRLSHGNLLQFTPTKNEKPGLTPRSATSVWVAPLTQSD